MKAACGIAFAEAKALLEIVTIDDLEMPFATPVLLWRTKQTIRDKDRLDRQFLISLLGEDER